jgi:hypothetical protein
MKVSWHLDGIWIFGLILSMTLKERKRDDGDVVTRKYCNDTKMDTSENSRLAAMLA